MWCCSWWWGVESGLGKGGLFREGGLVVVGRWVAWSCCVSVSSLFSVALSFLLSFPHFFASLSFFFLLSRTLSRLSHLVSSIPPSRAFAPSRSPSSGRTPCTPARSHSFSYLFPLLVPDYRIVPFQITAQTCHSARDEHLRADLLLRSLSIFVPSLASSGGCLPTRMFCFSHD